MKFTHSFLLAIGLSLLMSLAGVRGDGQDEGDGPTKQAKRRPNIIMVLSDDVGWADVSFTAENVQDAAIHTPELDRLAGNGVRLNHYYTHSTCTPARASLMTGRYSSNTGLTFAMLPGALSGLPPDMPTMPQVMRSAGYSAHMIGKWHVGHAQWKQTPVGRGFESHVGSYLWSMEYFSKELWELPWKHAAIDWVRAYENGTYHHYAEQRHTTEVLTDEALDLFKRHKADETDKPLFLYLAYTAAHAPLEPLPEDEAKCQHLAHDWRRKFCGLMKGLDRNVARVVEAAREELGEDTIVVFSSDNGGAPWFGGLNYPLRSGKTTPFDGGVRVPTFAIDLSSDKFFLGKGGRVWDGLAHVSDWLPTFASMGGADVSHIDGLDGKDLSSALREHSDSPRESVLHEMYYESLGEFIFPEDVAAYRKGKFKLIEQRGMRDAHWYYEPQTDALNSTDNTWTTWASEKALRYLEGLTTPGKFDTIRDLAVHIGIHAVFRGSDEHVDNVMLFDMENDPSETTNIAAQHPEVVEDLRRDIIKIRDARPPQSKFWMTIDRDREWEGTLKPGDCDMNNLILPPNCNFAHPWVADDADLDKIPVIFGAAAWPFIRDVLLKAVEVFTLPLVGTIIVVGVLRRLLSG